jgi:hypothetical protein
MVSEVPWKKALAYYQPRLQAAGYRVASVGDNPCKTLQLAFLTGPKEVAPKVGHKPIDVRPADRVTLADAKAAAAKAPKKAREVIGHDDTAKGRKAALVLVAKAARSGLISNADAMKLGQSKASPAEIRLAAERLARANQLPKAATYGGVGTRVTAHRQQYDQAWAHLRQAELLEENRRRARKHIAKMYEAGQITAKEARASNSQATPAQSLRFAAAFANNRGHGPTEMLAMPKLAQDYKGPVLRQAAQTRVATKQLSKQQKRLASAAKAAGVKVAEVQKLGNWLRRQMSEGMAGGDLTALMSVRFAAPLLEASAELVRTLRAEHEGLSGHLYVDAEAYASKTGTKGCEKAASTHRANQVPFVKAMSRCGGCAFANANGVCGKYGKELMAELPSDAADFKHRMVQAADAPDHEVTASLFNPGEFNLGSALSHIALDEEPEMPDIGVVFFGGGMEI